MRSCGGRRVLGVAVGLALLAAPLAAAAARLTDVRVGVHPGYTRIVLESDAALDYRGERGGDAIRVIVPASAEAKALTARSPHLTWLKVRPAGGTTEFVIKSVGPETVTLDANHPLAGMTVTFAGSVVDVRAATDDEVIKGHPL